MASSHTSHALVCQKGTWAKIGVAMAVAGGVVAWRKYHAAHPTTAFALVRPKDGSRETALITGASSGIGEAFARRLAIEGYDLVLVARRQQRLEALAEQLRKRHGVDVTVLVADLATDEGIAQVAEHIAACHTLAVLVNNAGFGTMGLFAKSDVAQQLAMIRLHVLASVQLTHAALPGMQARTRGAIINVASLAGFIAWKHNVTYCATKRYLITFSQALHAEQKPTSGVVIQALCPGLTHTEFHDIPAFRSFKNGTIPAFLWMSAKQVVNISLATLERGTVVCVPGIQNQITRAVMQNRDITQLFETLFPNVF